MTMFPRNLYAVGRDGNVGMAVPLLDTWSNLGGWTLKMLAFDSSEVMYGVGTDGNIGTWLTGKRCDAHLGNWRLDMVTFDPGGTPWCVGTGGNVGQWDGAEWGNVGNLARWNMAWLYFMPAQ